MKVKLLVVLMLCMLTINMKAQQTNLPCNLEFTIKADKFPEGMDYSERFVDFKWDISKLSLNESVSIEIVKIYDCFTGLEGNQTEPFKVLNLRDKELKSTTSYKIKHIDMVAKCFKWRYTIQSDKCLEQSEWKYFSFID